MTFPIRVLFLNLCDKTPVILRHITYQESNVIQRMIPRTNISSQESYQSILSRMISTIVPLKPLFQQTRPTDIIIAVGSSHINFLNPINLYLLIRSNRIITNIILFPNSPKIPFRTITSPNKTEDVISCYTPSHLKAYQPHSSFLILANI